MDIETKNDIEHWIRFHKCDSGIEARRAYSIVKALIDEVEHLEAALKPVLDVHITQDDESIEVYDSKMDGVLSVRAVREAQRIHNEGVK